MKSRQQFHNLDSQMKTIEDTIRTATGSTSYVIKGPYKGHELSVQVRFKSTERKSANELALQAYHACRFRGFKCDLVGHILGIDPASVRDAA